MSLEKLEVKQTWGRNALTDNFGTEVVGLDLSTDIPDDTAEALREELETRHLLLFREQEISPEDQARFARIFGEICIRTGYAQLGEVQRPEFGEMQHVSNTRGDGILGDGELHFHGDHYWHEEPLSALILYAIEIPTAGGGDTRFCDSGSAFMAMPSERRKELERLQCIHMYDFKGDYKKRHDATRIGQPGVFSATHSLIWHQPESGKPAIWFNPNSTASVMGLSQEEMDRLSFEIRSFIENDRFIYTHQWRVGDLLIWDNRMLLHARTPFDDSEPRTLRRTPVL